MARRRPLLLLIAAAVLAAAVWGVYGRAIHTPLIFDDSGSVTDNKSIRQLWPLVGDAENPGPLNLLKDLPTAGRPLVNFTLALNYHFGGADPVGYHVFNIMVHVLSALLLGAIVQRTLRLDYFGGRFAGASGPLGDSAGILAFAVALVWALHPLHTETVVYVTQRTELLMGFFYLATLYCSLHYWAASSSKDRTVWVALATLACLAGMASKEVMVTAPVMVLLFEWTFFSRSWRGIWRRSWPLYAGLALGWCLLALFNYYGPRSGTAGFHSDVPAYAWWFTQAKVLWMYLKLAVWPWPLVIHYGMPYLWNFETAWPWLILLSLLIVLTIYLLWRRSPVGFVFAWVVIILSPTLVVPILTEVAAERRMYLPLAGLVTLVLVGGFALVERASARGRARLPPSRALRGRARLLPSRALRCLAVVATSVLILVLGLVSATRLADFHDNFSLWQSAVIHQPDDYMAHHSFGVELQKQDLTAEAKEHFRKALEIKSDYPEGLYSMGNLLPPEEGLLYLTEALRLKPNYSDAHNGLGTALGKLGRWQEALPHFQEAVALKPENARAQNNLGTALVKLGRLEEGIQCHFEALRLKPDLAEAHNNLASALIQMGRRSEAIEHYQESLRLKPDDTEVHNALGVILIDEGRLQDALSHLREALRLKPDFADAYANVGNVLIQSGQAQEAIPYYQKALQLDPKHARALYNYGIALFTAGRIPEAIESYQQSLRLRPDHAMTHFQLGNALLKSGRPQEAIAMAQRALTLARAQNQPALAQQIEAWLTANRAGNPPASSP